MNFKTVLTTFLITLMSFTIAAAQGANKGKSLQRDAAAAADVLGLRGTNQQAILEAQATDATKGLDGKAVTDQAPAAPAATTISEKLDGIQITQPKDDKPVSITIAKLVVANNIIVFHSANPTNTQGQTVIRLTLDRKNDGTTNARYYSPAAVEFQIESLEGHELFDKMIKNAKYFEHSVNSDKCPLTLKIMPTTPLKLVEIIFSCKPQIAVAPVEPNFG